MATIQPITVSDRVKNHINNWCDLEQTNPVAKKIRQKYVICILDTLHDFYESPVKINNINYTKPDIVLKWANHYFLNSGKYCPLTVANAGGVVANITLNNQELSYTGANATTIGRELLFEWWDKWWVQTKGNANIKYCKASFNMSPISTNTKGLFISRRQKKSFIDLTAVTGAPLLVFSDQGVPKNPFKLKTGNYENCIGIGGLYDKTTRSSNTSDKFMPHVYPITLRKNVFEGVLGYNSITINNNGNTFILEYKGTNFTRNIDDTNLKHAKTQFRLYASAPATPSVKFFSDWLNVLTVSNIGNILKKAIQSGPLSSQVSITSQAYINITAQLSITSQLFEYLSLIFDMKRIGDWSQSYELNQMKPTLINSIFNTVDGIAAGCAVYFQEIATLLWKKTKKKSQGFELYNYNKEIICTQQIKNGDIKGSPPSYPNYQQQLHPDADFPDVNALTVAFSTPPPYPIMGGTGPEDNIVIACINEWTNNMKYYVELILCRGDLLGRDQKPNKWVNEYAKTIRELCDIDIKTWVEKDQEGMEVYFQEYLKNVNENMQGPSINLKGFLLERFKKENDDTQFNDNIFYMNCFFSIFKYEFDKLTLYESSQITKDVYSSISDSCYYDTFDTLTLIGNFLSYQLIKDTIIDFLNPIYDKSTSSVTFTDDSLNTGLTQTYKYELIMKMIEFELIKNDNERYVDFYNFDNYNTTLRNPKRGADDYDGEFQRAEKDAKIKGGKNKLNISVKNQNILNKGSKLPKVLKVLKDPNVLKVSKVSKDTKKDTKKTKFKKNIDDDTKKNISKYKLRVEQFKNKELSTYFEKKLKTYLNDKNINIYKIGITKIKGILKNIYKIE